MNIGILIPGFGAEKDDWALPVYQNFVRELSKSHHVRVIALRYPHTRQPYTYHDVQVIPLGWGAWTRSIRRLRLWWDTFQTVRQLHQKQPFDVLHGIWADETGALAGWIGKVLDIPSVVSIAGGELVGFPDIEYGLQISRYGRWIVGQALEHNTCIVYPSMMGIPKPQDLPGNKARLIPLGIDNTMFHPIEHSRKSRQNRKLIHVGSLIPVKNQHQLLDIMTYLPTHVSLDIIGEGILEPDLKHYAEQLGIHDRVTFHGKISHENLRQYYNDADLLIVTSRHEAFCMAILEAGACGTPTIGSSVGLISDRVEFTLTGDDAEELAGLIVRYLEASSDLKCLQQTSINTITKQYTIQTMAKQYIDLYQHLL